jgi:hypothetical protein
MNQKFYKLLLLLSILFITLSFYPRPVKASIKPPNVSQFELTFNPSGPEFTNGKLNPFAVPKIQRSSRSFVTCNSSLLNPLLDHNFFFPI